MTCMKGKVYNSIHMTLVEIKLVNSYKKIEAKLSYKLIYNRIINTNLLKNHNQPLTFNFYHNVEGEINEKTHCA